MPVRSTHPRSRSKPIAGAKASVLATTVAVGLCTILPSAEATARTDDGEDARSSRPVTLTTAGPVRGVRAGPVDRYRGIPYAAPPVGDARWRAPRPPDGWLLPRDASTSGSPCPQLAEGKPLPTSDEDCLYLEVTTPRPTRATDAAGTTGTRSSATAGKPVMVWLHGGGNTLGSGSEFDPTRMATSGDVVVVTLNYRLGALGFFGYDGLPGSGSFGLLDQQAALRWVRRNAVFFGGDPSNVTLFGESAGGIDSCAHLTSPTARGLFDKVILQSGSCATRIPTSPVDGRVRIGHDDFWTPVREVRRRGREVADELGCSADGSSAAPDERRRDTLACLRALPVEKLLPYEFAFGLATATATLPENPHTAVASGEFHRVPVLSGYTRDESRYTTMLVEYATGPITRNRYDALLEQAFGAEADRVRAAYPVEEHDSASLAFAAMDTDRVFACPQLTTNRELARRVPTYGYEFADRTAPTYGPFLTDLPPGAAHASELAYLFDLAIGPWGPGFEEVELTARQRALGDEMIRSWTDFAHTGRPAEPAAWPRFEDDTAPYVRSFEPIRASGQIRPDTNSEPRVDAWAEHQCDLWADLRNDTGSSG